MAEVGVVSNHAGGGKSVGEDLFKAGGQACFRLGHLPGCRPDTPTQ